MNINNYDSNSIKLESLFLDICCYGLISPAFKNNLIDILYNNDIFIFKHHSNIINHILYNKSIKSNEYEYLNKIKEYVQIEFESLENMNILDKISLYSNQK